MPGVHHEDILGIYDAFENNSELMSCKHRHKFLPALPGRWIFEKGPSGKYILVCSWPNGQADFLNKVNEHLLKKTTNKTGYCLSRTIIGLYNLCKFINPQEIYFNLITGTFLVVWQGLTSGLDEHLFSVTFPTGQLPYRQPTHYFWHYTKIKLPLQLSNNFKNKCFL